MRAGTKTYARTVGYAIGLGLLLLVGMTKCVDWANAGGDYHPLSRGSYGTFYDEATSVFCATRSSSVSCVYVPRDTVRRGE